MDMNYFYIIFEDGYWSLYDGDANLVGRFHTREAAMEAVPEVIR